MPNNRDLGPSAPSAASAPVVRPTRRRGTWSVTGAALALAVVAGCGGHGAEHDHVSASEFTGCEIVGGATPAAGATVPELAVQLGDYVVVPAASSVAAGPVRMRATNIGIHAHELVVVKADAVASLPTEKNGALAEEKLPDLALAGEIEEFPPTQQCDAVFDLEPGRYVLLCNLVEKVNGKTVAHLREGMATTFTVNG